MTGIDREKIQSAAFELACADPTEALEFYVEQLGFRLDAIFPADAPRVATISGYGVRIRLDRDGDTAAGVIRLSCHDERKQPGSVETIEERVSPDGTRIHFTRADPT